MSLLSMLLGDPLCLIQMIMVNIMIHCMIPAFVAPLGKQVGNPVMDGEDTAL
jgi:hypothetical protein